MNSLMAKFFWGKTGQTRYLSFIAWSKICKPVEHGGLGVKDIHSFGEALFLKMVWTLMAEEDKPWVKLCKAKYFPKIGYWRAKNKTGCSKMWTQVLKMRSQFMGQVFWKLGTGKTVFALSQPWFDNWDVRVVTVCDLLDEQTAQWDMQELQRLFNQSQIQQIIQNQNKPEPHARQKDLLIWKGSKDGRYSVKEGYKLITQAQLGLQSGQLRMWSVISKWKGIEPKVKLFLWRLIHRGLPMAVNMNVRLPNFSPMCQRCHEENEYEMHCLFLCPNSRLVWFASALGLRAQDLPLNIDATIQQVTGNLDQEGIKLFAYTLWEIWKKRNKAVIEHSQFQPQAVLKRVVASIRSELSIANISMVQGSVPVDKHEVYNQGWQVLMDASWVNTNCAGGAFIVYDKGTIHSIGLQYFHAPDTFLAETMIL
ncbi:hypothetical protein LUZ61_000898 [Rhynchospora tenuis]|uniref:Reverse transcriptase zinc-binding domain-containing protein n=1 Tax=Rhynchospora tenuis TaxID=198213 RepID=A0AAD5ZG79_9POAL|nr:hypothetical protein LUZ61_000898 [Rhynchospora tenuis]